MEGKNIDLTRLEEVVIRINRVAKVQAGRRRFLFTALVVVGDKNGHVGLGYAKALEVPLAIQKAILKAKSELIEVPINKNTVPHEIHAKFKASEILIKPAAPGTGIIAGATARAVLELAGYKDVLTKSLGSNNQINLARAVIKALQSLRPIDKIAKDRGKEVKQIFS